MMAVLIYISTSIIQKFPLLHILISIFFIIAILTGMRYYQEKEIKVTNKESSYPSLQMTWFCVYVEKPEVSTKRLLELTKWIQ
jgi:hypothetical protein